MSQNPAFRSHAFCANVVENVWPGGASRLHRNLVRHGRRVSYERIARDPWQREGGLCPASEAELAQLEESQPYTPAGENDLPF